MKKFLLGTLMYPVSLVVGWFFTKLSERFEMVLDLDNLDLEDEQVEFTQALKDQRTLRPEPL